RQAGHPVPGERHRQAGGGEACRRADARLGAGPAPGAVRGGAAGTGCLEWRAGPITHGGILAPMTRTVTPALVVPHGFTARILLRSTLLPELVERCRHVGIFAPSSAIPRLRDELPGAGFSFYPLNDR